MPTRNVVITQHQVQMIDELVKVGRYQNASEVLREGLRLVEKRERSEEDKLEKLREAAKLGFDQIDAGRYREINGDDALDTYIDELREKARGQARRAG